MRDTESTFEGRITVYGSCVARDSARELKRRGWSVERYVARQSLISVGRPADAGDLNLSVLTSPFARRSFLSDMVGNLEAQLTTVAARTDLLLWDLNDERLGVLETAPGAFLTRSTEAMTAGLYDNVTARLVELGTTEHLHLWRPSLHHFSAFLKQLDLMDKAGLPLFSLPFFFCPFSIPHSYTRTTSIGEYTSTQLLEDVYNAVALGSIAYLFRARVDTKRGFRGNSLFQSLFYHRNRAGEIFVGGVSTRTDESPLHL